jgi:hypothetical protein
MPSATTAARNGGHFLANGRHRNPLRGNEARTGPRVGERRALRMPDGAPTEWDSPLGQVEARPERRISVLTRKWHARFLEVPRATRQKHACRLPGQDVESNSVIGRNRCGAEVLRVVPRGDSCTAPCVTQQAAQKLWFVHEGNANAAPSSSLSTISLSSWSPFPLKADLVLAQVADRNRFASML